MKYSIVFLAICTFLTVFVPIDYHPVDALEGGEDLQPFIYWSAPDNSFGAEGYQEVNWSWINDHVNYSLLCDAKDKTYLFHLNFSYVFGDARKYSYWFTPDEKGYYLLTVVFNSEATTSYIDNVGHTAVFNYSDGSLSYNFTDLYELVGDFDFDVNLVDGVFVMTLGTQINQAQVNKTFYLDPIFGDTGTGASAISCESDIIAGKFQMGAVGGTADNITVRIWQTSGSTNAKFQCMIYNFGTNTLVGSTDEYVYTTSGSYNWVTLDFSVNPTLVANAWYWIGVWANASTGYNRYCRFSTSGGNGVNDDAEVYDGSPPNPWSNTTYDADALQAIYCSYTTGASPPSPPSALSVVPVYGSSTSLSESWTKGAGADYTRIQYKTGSYPTSISDGTNTYNGTGTSDSTGSLVSGTTYYFKAFSWNVTNGLWSTTNATDTGAPYTVPSGPGFILAETYSTTQINLSFSKGTGNFTRIMRKTGGYPSSISDGTLEYNSTGTIDTSTGLTCNVAYYYRGWCFNNTTGLFSSSYASGTNTTSSCPGAVSYSVNSSYCHVFYVWCESNASFTLNVSCVETGEFYYSTGNVNDTYDFVFHNLTDLSYTISVNVTSGSNSSIKTYDLYTGGSDSDDKWAWLGGFTVENEFFFLMIWFFLASYMFKESNNIFGILVGIPFSVLSISMYNVYPIYNEMIFIIISFVIYSICFIRFLNKILK